MQNQTFTNKFVNDKYSIGLSYAPPKLSQYGQKKAHSLRHKQPAANAKFEQQTTPIIAQQDMYKQMMLENQI